MTLFLIITGFVLLALAVFLFSGKYNDPDDIGNDSPNYYTQYVRAYNILKHDLGRDPTIPEMTSFVYGQREIDELIKETDDGTS